MPLDKGARLGRYEIVSALGAGGMGEVYRARDTRLDRSVAVKVVLHLAATTEVRQRFEVEARAISSLQHPHICALHDVGCQDGVDFLVMELVEGETLAARLERGPLPLAEALRFGGQIADALAGAHRRGIVHRDLKPANVMLTRAGVKLLDFGLARQRATPAAGPLLSQEKTRAAPLTAEGTILGTLHYMAPEQLEGRPVDSRADLFSLGAVLYEMVTGTRAFDGASPASVISAVLRERPPAVSTRAPLAPPALDRLVEHCLAKDPEERWESAHDLRLELAAIAGQPAAERGMTSAAPARTRLPWAVAALAAAAAAGLAFALLRGPAEAGPTAPAVRFELPAPAGGSFRDNVEGVSMAIAPDGSAIGFVAAGPDAATSSIWIRPLGELAARSLAGTEGATSLFWSPDGQAIAFFANGKLKRIAPSGGTPVVICDVPIGIGLAGSWGRDSILFATVHGDGIHRVSSAGGTPVVLIEGATGSQRRVVWPWYLPDGERFVYLASLEGVGFELRLADARGESRTVGPTASRVELVDDQAVFVRDGALISQRFDPEGARLLGTPVALAPAVRSFGSTGSAAFATSRSGVAVLATETPENRPTWFDPEGRVLGSLGEGVSSNAIAISPDGRRAITDRLRADLRTYDLWMLDLERGVETRLTSEPGTEVYALWLPGARTIVYSASRGASPRLFRRDLASGREEPLLGWGAFQIAIGVTPDGRELLLRRRAASGGFELLSVSLESGGEPAPVLRPGLAVWAAALSPDGETLAFVTQESGRLEAYVRARRGGESLRASIDGARDLRFSRDGRTLFFVSPDRKLWAVSVTTAPELAVGAPRLQFALPPLGWAAFDVAPDGRFLALVPKMDVTAAPLTVISGGGTTG